MNRVVENQRCSYLQRAWVQGYKHISFKCSFWAYSTVLETHKQGTCMQQFQKSFITFLKRVLFCPPKKVVYTSDGAASQYRNRKILSTCAIMKLISGSQPSNTFLLLLMESVSDGVGGSCCKS